MRTTRVYYPGEIADNSVLVLDGTASHHLVRVLRMKTGAQIVVFDGSGFEYQCEITDASQRAAGIRVLSRQACASESPLQIHLLQGVSRGDRMDLSIQKATELGVSSITPVMCERTNISLDASRARKKLDHWRSIVVSACEQSGRSRLAVLADIRGLDAALSNCDQTLKLVLDPQADTSLRKLDNTKQIALLAGPEGGLSDREIERAKLNGFVGVSLGPRILRTETAGMACIAALQALWGDLG